MAELQEEAVSLPAGLRAASHKTRKNLNRCRPLNHMRRNTNSLEPALPNPPLKATEAKNR